MRGLGTEPLGPVPDDRWMRRGPSAMGQEQCLLRGRERMSGLSGGSSPDITWTPVPMRVNTWRLCGPLGGECAELVQDQPMLC